MKSELGALEKDIVAAQAVADRTEEKQAKATFATILEPSVHGAPPPSLHGERVQLPSGAVILIRAVEQEDGPQLAANLAHLGALSRYHRFRAPLDGYTVGELEWLTQVDHEHHEALVAIDPLSASIVGVAQYVCMTENERCAHVTYAVEDAWQHRGVGNALIDRLAIRAQANGVEELSALMLAGDERARLLLARVSQEIEARPAGGMVELIGKLRVSD